MTQTVSLVSVTPNALEHIAYCARVSNPSNQNNSETAPRLLAYLVRHRHWSPFEMAHMVLEINTERDIARQILRHRSFSFQEFSTRYAKVLDQPTHRRQHDSRRQCSTDDLDDETRRMARTYTTHAIKTARLAYDRMIAHGVARETARRILPECSPTRLYMAGTIRSWIHYVQLRASPDTQLEHQEIALQCRALLLEQLPDLSEVLTLDRHDVPPTLRDLHLSRLAE